MFELSTSCKLSTKVGFELETLFKVGTDGYHKGLGIIADKDGLDTIWDVHRDGSIGDNGAEFVLRNPLSCEDTLVTVEKLFTLLNESKVVDSVLCGTHIHIDCRNLGNRSYLCFVTLSLIVQELLYAMCPPERQVNNFICKIVVNKSFCDLLAKILYHRTNLTAGRVLIPNQFKYSGINLWSMGKDGRGSTEFRMFPSTTNYEDARLWIELLSTLKDKAMTFRGVGGLHTIISQIDDPNELLRFLFNGYVEEIKKRVKPAKLKQALERGLLDGRFIIQQMKDRIQRGEI